MRVALIMIVGMLLNGCSIILPWDDFKDRMQYMKESNPSGCSYIKGSGTPPASRVDGAIVGAWGKDMTAKDCAEILKNLPGG